MSGRHRRPAPPRGGATAAGRPRLLPVLATLLALAAVTVPLAWLASRAQGDLGPAAHRPSSGSGPASTGPPGTASPPATSPSPPPPVSPRPSPSPPPRPRLATFQVVITGSSSWVRVTRPGQLLIDRRMVHGERASFAASSLYVFLDNAGATTISVNGKPMRRAGAIGQIARGTIRPA